MAGEIQDSTFSTARVIPEVSLAVTPSAAYYELNVTSAIAKRTRTRERPNVWSRSRRPHKSRIVSKAGSLPIIAPMQYENLLPVHEAFFGAARAAAVTVTDVDIEFDGTTNQILRVANGLGVFLFGRMVHVSGAGEAQNNGWKGPITVSAAGALTIPPGQIVDEAAGESIRLYHAALLDAETEKSLSFQWHGTKIDYRKTMVGAKADKLTWDWQLEQYITESFDLVGRAPETAGAGIGTGVVAGWPKASPFFTSAEDLKRVYVGNAALGTNELCLSKLSLAAMNNRNAVKSIDLGEAKDHIFGQLFVELTGEAYADAAAILVQEAIDANETFFGFVDVEDPDGNAMCAVALALSGEGEINPAERNSLVNFGDVKFEAHDPAKDNASDYYAAGAGAGYMFGLFYAPAP